MKRYLVVLLHCVYAVVWLSMFLAVCQAFGGLPDAFLLLRYSVLFTIESLYLLYLLVMSSFICSMR